MTYERQLIELLKHRQFGRTNFLTAATGGSYQWRRKTIGKLPELRRHNPNGSISPFKGGLPNRDARYPRHFHRIYSLASRPLTFNWHQVFTDDIMLSVEAAARIHKAPLAHCRDILKAKPFKLEASISYTFEKGKATEHFETFDKPVEPDDLFAVWNEFIVVEADRGTETHGPHTFKDKKSILRSLLQYIYVLTKKTYKEWDIPHLKVLFVFDSEARMHYAMHVLRDIIKVKSSSILFTCIPEFNSDAPVAPKPALDILERPLLRVGYEPFYLKEQLNGRQTTAN